MLVSLLILRLLRNYFGYVTIIIHYSIMLRTVFDLL